MPIAKRAKRAKRNPPTTLQSEKDAWSTVVLYAREIATTPDLSEAQVARRALDIARLANNMLDQLKKGVHKNPPLTVFALANPPRNGIGKLMSDHLFDIDYKHKANGKKYFHEFRKGTLMHAMPDGSIRISRPGARVWGDFPAE